MAKRRRRRSKVVCVRTRQGKKVCGTRIPKKRRRRRRRTSLGRSRRRR